MIDDSSRVVCRLSGKLLASLVVLVVGPAFGRPRAEGPRATPLPPRALAQIGTDDLRTREPITDIAFSPDGRLIVAAEGLQSPSKVSIFDVRTGRQVRRITPPDPDDVSVVCVAFTPDGTKLAWGEQEGDVALWDLAGDRLLYRARLHDGTANDVAFSPDGRLLASAGGDGAVQLRSVENLAGIAAKGGRGGMARG